MRHVHNRPLRLAEAAAHMDAHHAPYRRAAQAAAMSARSYAELAHEADHTTEHGHILLRGTGKAGA
jgi:hypothetical protein